MSPFLVDIVAKVLEWRPERKFAQYSTLDRRFVESKMCAEGQVCNIFSRTDAENLFATISARLGRAGRSPSRPECEALLPHRLYGRRGSS
jgi:hypothetical protein